MNADIILLQEVFAKVPNGLNLSDCLARSLELNAAFAPARKKLRTYNSAPVLCHSGLAVLAKGEIRDHAKLHLPQDERDGERLAQFVSVQTHGVSVLIANTHLTHLKDVSNLRQQELQTLRSHIDECAPHDVVIVGGDMNAAENDPIFDVLDGFDTINPQSIGTQTTLNAVNGTVPGAGLIDHIFAASEDMTIGLQGQTALDVRDEATGIYPSDHKAVVLDITISMS